MNEQERKVTDGIDADMVRRALGLLMVPGQCWEVRALEADVPGAYGTVKALCGWFDDVDKCIAELSRIRRAKGVYVTLNPVDKALLAKAYNRLAAGGTATKNDHINERRWLLVDVDSERPADISATPDELAATRRLAERIVTDLSRAGWPRPIVADSGNGSHLLYRIELVRDDGGLVERCLDALAKRYDTPQATIDRVVHNAARISKLYGTWVRKGDDCPEVGRVHRLAAIVDAPAQVEVVPTPLLLSLGGEATSSPAQAQPSRQATVGHTGDKAASLARIEVWRADGRLSYTRSEDRDGWMWHYLPCPWASGHGGADAERDAALMVSPTGAFAFKCFHASCSGRGWQELKAVLGLSPARQQQAAAASSHPTSPSPAWSDYYYDAGRKEYLVRNGRGVWLSLAEGAFKKHLAASGIRARAGDGEVLSPADLRILDIRDKWDVAYAGALAGCMAGFYETGGGDRVLVTSSPVLPKPNAGDWSLLRQFLYGLLDEQGSRQVEILMAWLKTAYQALASGRKRTGQALVIAGERDSGKSLLVRLIVEILGGRYASPYQYMCGASPFNAHMFGAEVLVVDDEESRTDIQSRREFGAQLKQIVATDRQQCHAKGRTPVSLSPFWRLVIALNDEPENLQVLPPFDAGMEDKLIILRAHRTPMPVDTSTPEGHEALLSGLRACLPAFLAHLTGWQIPRELTAGRFGVVSWQHPSLVASVDSLSPEFRLLSLIDAHLSFLDGSWRGTAEMLERELCGQGDAAYDAKKLLYYPTACGVYLGRLSIKYPDRFQRRRHGHRREWAILPPNSEEDTGEQWDTRDGGYEVEPLQPVTEGTGVTGFRSSVQENEDRIIKGIVESPSRVSHPSHPIATLLDGVDANQLLVSPPRQEALPAPTSGFGDEADDDRVF